MACSRMPKWIVRPYGSPGTRWCSAGQEGRRLVDRRVVRAGQVGGAAPQLGEHRAERLQHLAGRGTGGDALARLEIGQRVLPALGQLARARPGRTAAARSGLAVAPLVRRPSPTRPRAWRPRSSDARGCGARTSSATSKVALGVEAEDAAWWPRPRRRRAPSRARPRCSARSGAGQAMIVRIAMNDGLPVSALAASSARGQRVGSSRSPSGLGLDALHVPAVRLVPLERRPRRTRSRCRPRWRCGCRPRAGQVAELLVAGQRGRLGGDALLQVSRRTGDRPDVVVERGLAGGRRPGRTGRARSGRPSPCPPRWRHPGPAGRSWSRRRWCGRTRGGPGSSSPRCGAPSGRPAPGRSRPGTAGCRGSGDEWPADSTNRSRPVQSRVRRVVPHHLLEEDVRGGRQAHRRAGVAVADLLHGVGGQDTDGVDGPLVQLGPLEVLWWSAWCSPSQRSSPHVDARRAGERTCRRAVAACLRRRRDAGALRCR